MTSATSATVSAYLLIESIALLSAASAASCSASDSVGCACIVRCRSSRARRVLHRQHRFGDQLAGHRADDVHAEDLVVVLRGDDLHEALRRFHRARAAAGQERERADLVRRGRWPSPAPRSARPRRSPARCRSPTARSCSSLRRTCRRSGPRPSRPLPCPCARASARARSRRRPRRFGAGAALVIDLDEAALVELHAGAVARADPS